MTEADRLTEKEKMLAGLPYMYHDRELDAEHLKSRDLCLELNLTPSSEKEKRNELARQIFGKMGRNLGLISPIICDYGTNIVIGNDCFINANCVFVDCAKITLGDGVLIAPNVAFYTAEHPLEPVARRRGIGTARPITIGSNVWIGGNTIILPGVTIGGNSVIGAGSVVAKNIPANVLAYGNPCRVIKKIC